ncbi:tail fiber protein [Citrobacter koseri]|uniref:tail fiber protein n=3 Tax=Citrobacter koseri TaxID=545 RepID=UPI001FCC9337|nr:tail fiber protein [Citrobacter koseri]MDM9066539.1 tail fiber protein [Citrobacter koseri]MDM9082936.1 tail fiber protein [Citrobacter koseri]MDM9088701.1 tail fiber protein [Citrobacter koseri]MDM9097330.1 tail fiber protein [Citrobacter koseri]BDG83500.1 hypothetical protein TUM13189_10600 [Citrobacter koseri]
MFHLDNNSGISSMPAPAAQQSSATRWFTEGGGTDSPSWPGQDWFNIVQAELLNVLTVAGIAPKKTQFNQLALAIKAIVNKDALLKTNLLSEIKDAGAAAQKTTRDNIGLKGGATADLTTSDHDITAGRLLKVGDYGLGVSNGSVKSLASIYDITCSGEYNAMGSGTTSPTTGIPADSGNTRFAVYAGNIYSNQYLVTLTSNVHFYVGLVNTANKTATWSKFYNTFNKPSAPDVDAVSASNGGVFSKFVRFNEGLTLRGSKVGDAGMVGISPGSDAASFDGANLLLQSWYGIGFYSSFPADAPRGVMGYVDVRMGRLVMKEQIIPGNYANFDNRYQAKGNYTPAGQAYTKAESDGRFQPKGNYTPAGQAYTKAESDARFVRDVRLGAQVLVSASANGSYASLTAPSGHQLTAILDRDTSRWPMPDSPDNAYARPVQKFLNNQWVTVSQL